MMKKSTSRLVATAGAVAAAVALASCATGPSPAEMDKIAAQTMQTSFRDEGIAKADRIKQDLAQAACSSDKAPDEATAARIMAEAKASVKWPAGGQYLGDWREGERIAQSGRGMTWTDASAAPSANGGNCYNCHQISKEEISYGTIGPLDEAQLRHLMALLLDPKSPVNQ
jgi:sulfur-oxidizing protein SoxX